MTTETILSENQIERVASIDDHNRFTLRAHEDMLLARAIEQAVLQSLPYQNSFSIRGDSYAGVYVWVGNENLVHHIPKVLAQTANDPQSMLGAVAAKCIQELKRFSEMQSPEIQALRKDAKEGWKEATIAWEVCASIHRKWAKGKDAVFNTRQADFVRHARDARAAMEQQK